MVLPVALGWALPASAGPITATVCLRDSAGAGISSAEAFVNAGSFVSLGFTDTTGCVSTDLASALGKRTFRIVHRGLTQNRTQNTSTNPTVTFQTVAVNIRLLDSTGVGIPGAGVEYNGGGWQSLGTTDATGTVVTELLGLNTNFRVTHRGLRVNKSQNTSTNPNVTFQTVAVNIRLLDSSGAVGIPGAGVEYNGGGWQSLGTTDAAGTAVAELLGLNTSFRVTHTGQTQNKTQNTSTNPTVAYQTGRVLQGTGPRVLAWYASGWHPFTNGVELLPGKVTFDFNTGPNQAHAVVAGSTIYVPVAPTAPVVTADDQSANEGQPVTLASVAFVDQEAAQTHRASIDWGDGSLETGLVTQANGLAGTVAGSHVYADDGSYNVEICVSDDGNPDAEGCDTLQITVANSAPTVTILSAGPGEEGTELTLSSLVADADPVTLSWTVTLTGTTIATGMGTDLAFTPADDGVYEVALTADDGDGGNTTATGQVAIVNLAPSAAITGAPTSVTEDEVVTLGSSANDPGPTDVLTYAWAVTRDGATAATGSGPGFSFIPDLAGSYEVTLVVDDGDGATATSQVIIEVTATLQTEPVPGPGPGAEPAPEAEPVPTPEPPVSEPPAPEEAPPAENQETNQGTSNTAEAASPTLELGFAPASSDAPQLEELGLPVSPRSEPVSIVVEPETRSDQVMLLALIAQPADDPWSDVPSTGLLLSLLWLGPTLVVLARFRLRRRAH